jgi:sialidase-1
MGYNDNPIDNLEGLASFKVPVLNVIGIHDGLAPREENTDIFVQRYTALGGPAAIYPVTEGPQELHGHHFPVKHTVTYADFIVDNSYPVKKILPYADYIHTRSTLSYFYQAAAKNKEATVAFLGGSITYNPGWRQKVCGYLKERFPDTRFHFIAAGIPSLGSLAHSFRLQRDVLDSGKVDLMFLEAAVNDRGSGVDSLTQLRSLEGIVRHAKKSNPAMDIVVMEFADTYKTNDYNNGSVPAEVARHETIATYYNLPSVNQAKAVAEKIHNHEFNWNDDFKDIHPAPYGQELYFEMIKQLFQNCFDKQPQSEPLKIVSLPKSLTSSSFEKGHYYAIGNARYDKDWILFSNWTPANKQSTREGFVNVPMLTTEKPGASLVLPFKGNAIGMAIISGNDAGIISYNIDNGPAKTLDLYTQWSGMLHLPYYILLGSNLPDRHHTLTIKMLERKNSNSKGNACRIVHFLVND